MWRKFKNQNVEGTFHWTEYFGLLGTRIFQEKNMRKNFVFSKKLKVARVKCRDKPKKKLSPEKKSHNLRDFSREY